MRALERENKRVRWLKCKRSSLLMLMLPIISSQLNLLLRIWRCRRAKSGGPV
jgi:hypothetical protein